MVSLAGVVHGMFTPGGKVDKHSRLHRNSPARQDHVAAAPQNQIALLRIVAGRLRGYVGRQIVHGQPEVFGRGLGVGGMQHPDPDTFAARKLERQPVLHRHHVGLDRFRRLGDRWFLTFLIAAVLGNFGHLGTSFLSGATPEYQICLAQWRERIIQGDTSRELRLQETRLRGPFTPPLRRSRRSRASSPHFSPGGVMMAQEFFPQRVLASEERSGHYVRASMCVLRGKGQPEHAQRRLYSHALIRRPITY